MGDRVAGSRTEEGEPHSSPESRAVGFNPKKADAVYLFVAVYRGNFKPC